jgi:hypothetical protein
MVNIMSNEMLSIDEIKSIITKANLAKKYNVTCVGEDYDSTLVEVHNQGTLNFILHAFEPKFESILNRRLGNLEKDENSQDKNTGFSKNHKRTLGRMYKYMGVRTQQGGVELLDKMVEKADSNRDYSQRFFSVLVDKSSATDALRELASDFGDYWVGVKHQNKVDAIDSAICMIHDKSRNKENDELSI